jgi:hypothetical protein
MHRSIRREAAREWEDMQKELGEEASRGKGLVEEGVIEFCKNWLKLTPAAYQERLLLDQARFIVARWARQTGKTNLDLSN